jgi:ABC-type glycerol-3-phosphate transport system permease component
MNLKSYRFVRFLSNFFIYFILTFFAIVMLFPFFYMLSTSFKIPADTFRYPPRMLPRDPAVIEVEGFENRFRFTMWRWMVSAGSMHSLKATFGSASMLRLRTLVQRLNASSLK